MDREAAVLNLRASRVLVVARSEGLCEICGKGLSGLPGWDWSVHHRMARKMGGTKRAWVNMPANLLAICGSGTTGCHGHIESHRAEAYECGWLLHEGELACEISVLLRYGIVRLDDDGTYEVIE